MANRTKVYSDAYKIECRSIWYDNGCPSATQLHKILPPNETGDIVELGTLKEWIHHGGWYEWKDSMDVQLSVKMEDELLARKVELIKEQLEQNRLLRNKAYDDIKQKGFDSSASAVSAFFKASAEERGLMQIEKVIEDLSRKQTIDLQKEFKELAERAGATEGVVVEETEEE